MRYLLFLVCWVVGGCGATPGGDDMNAGDGAVPAGCSNGAKDGDETDLDCGGSCGPCAVGKGCLHASDCDSGLCANNVCDASCSDAVQNAGETDVDCGGGACPKCGTGRKCLMASDCASDLCTNNLCKAAAGCSNGMKDGSETDVDCGGAMCGKCADGKMCAVDEDCAGGACSGNLCGTAGQCPPVGFLLAAPNPLDEGITPFPFTADRDVTFTNKSGQDLMISKATITSGGNPPAFSISGYGPMAPPLTLGAGASFNVAVRFNPPQAMSYTGVLTVATAKGSVSVCLAGTARASSDAGF